MPIGWEKRRRLLVSASLSRHPLNSGQCLEAAREILPVAQEQDPASNPWKIEPREGRFVVPQVSTGARWFHHYTVEVEAHCVDALAGVDGTLKADYLETHWRYPDALNWVNTELTEDL